VVGDEEGVRGGTYFAMVGGSPLGERSTDRQGGEVAKRAGRCR